MALYVAPPPGPEPAAINALNAQRRARGLPPLTPEDIAFLPRANQIAAGSYPRHVPGAAPAMPRGWEPFATNQTGGSDVSSMNQGVSEANQRQMAAEDAETADAGSSPGYGMVDRWLFGDPPPPKARSSSGGMLAAYDRAAGSGGGMLSGLLGNGPLAQGLPILLAGAASGLANNRGVAGSAARGYLGGMQVGQQFRQQRVDDALTRYKLGRLDAQDAADQRLQAALGSGQFAGLTPQQRQLAATLPPDQRAAFLARVAAQRPEKPSPPTVRDFTVGDRVVTRQFDPDKGQWVDLSTAPRWQPGNGPVSYGPIVKDATTGMFGQRDSHGLFHFAPNDSGALNYGPIEQDPATGRWGQKDSRGQFHFAPGESGGVSPAQQANNDEIDAARRYLVDNNLTPDEIKRRTQQQSATGRDNPDYDPNLESTVRTALQHKVGRDDDFSDIQHRLRVGSGAAPSGAPGAPQPQGTSAALPRNASGQLDKAQLKVGTTYDVPGKGAYRWNGMQFQPVQ